MSDQTQQSPAGRLPQSTSSASAGLRVWPGVLLVLVMPLARFVPGYLEGGFAQYWMVAMIGPMACCLLLVIWWLAASRATWKERVFGFLGLVAALGLTMALVEPMMRGPGTIYVTLPMGLTAFAIGVALLRKRSPLARTGVAFLLALAGFGFSMLLRNDGMDGDYQLTLHWRWSPSTEERTLAMREAESPSANVKSAAMATNLALATRDWPAFRGADRSGIYRGPAIETNWSAHPPKLL